MQNAPSLASPLSDSSAKLVDAANVVVSMLGTWSLPIKVLRRRRERRDVTEFVPAPCSIAFVESPVELEERVIALCVQRVELRCKEASVDRGAMSGGRPA